MSQKSEKKLRRLIKKKINVDMDEQLQEIMSLSFPARFSIAWKILFRLDFEKP